MSNTTTTDTTTTTTTTTSTTSNINNSDLPHECSGSYEKTNKTVPSGFKVVEEGCAKILFHEKSDVFYNNVQVVNRDLSTLVIKVYNEVLRKQEYEALETKRLQKLESNPNNTYLQKPTKPFAKLRILEALSATGLRSIRYWKEIEGIDYIIANDLSSTAVEAIKQNVQFNEISPEKHVIPNLADAIEYMYLHRSPEKQFDIVDIDPYGSASVFLDGAVQCVKDGGLLCVTCTDLAVLTGSNNNAGTCFAKYGSIPVLTKACHEQALRILLATMQTSASRYKRYIVPLLSFHIDFYVRVFVRVYSSAKEVKESFSKFGYCFQCNGCDAYSFQPIGHCGEKNNHHPAFLQYQPNCEQCGSKIKIGGPMWASSIHDSAFALQCINYLDQHAEKFKAEKRIKGLLTVASQELPDVPLFYNHSSITKRLKLASPPFTQIRSAIINAGYKLSLSHCCAKSIKTNAPIDFIYQAYRTCVEQHMKTLQDKNQNEEQVQKEQNNMKEEEEHNNQEHHSEQNEDSTKKKGSKSSGEKEPNEQKLRKIAKKEKKKETFNIVSEKLLSKPITTEAMTGAKKTGVAAFLPNPEANWGPKRRAGMKRERDNEDANCSHEGEPEELQPSQKQRQN